MRHLQATKRLRTGKLKSYKNLAAFNTECGTRRSTGNLCEVTNVRCTRDGGGLATVRSRYPYTDEGIYSRHGKPSGTWLLHFASCAVMKDHLRNRATSAREGILSGSKRRRSRR